MTDLKTTAPVRHVRRIEDIRAIEAAPYDQQVTARNLYDLFRATAQHHGDQKALTVLRSPDPSDVGVSLTHKELLTEVTRAANLFRALGLEPGKGVAAFLAPTLPEFPVLHLGAQVAGVASTLNYLLSAEAIVDLLNAEGATLLVIPAAPLDQTCWDKAQGIMQAVPSLTRVLVIGAEGELPEGFTALAPLLAAQDGNALAFAPTQDRDAVCALFHTGGTTGRPKLVPLSHGNQIHAAFGFGQVFGYDATDTVINGFPFFHVGGTMTVGLSVLAAGGHMIVPSPYALRPPEVVRNYWRLVEHFRATVIGGVPTSIAALTAQYRPGIDVSTVRMAGTGGAVCPAAVNARFTEVTGIRLFETYGMTETSAAIAFNPGRGDPLAGAVGFRAPYSETRILRLSDHAPCAPGEAGLVQVRGPQVFRGYVEAAHNKGVMDADGWLTTGDVGYLDPEERLILTGREKDLIVRSGHNIDPAAIEDVANQHPDVQISAAVGMPDQYAGEVPALFVVPAPGKVIDLPALEAFVKAGLHEPPARPRAVLVIDTLPVTAVGKIFKPALRDLAIREKLRQEVAAHCGPHAVADTRIGTDAQGRVEVQAKLYGADPAQIAGLTEALAPLPQRYSLTAGEEAVTLTFDGPVATLTLNRPGSLNAASRSLMHALDARLQQLAAMPDLRAVILTGAGRAFCAGGDLREFEDTLRHSPEALIETLAYNQRVISMVEDLPVPVIGAANGVAVAGGLELLLCCDVVIASQTARFADGHAQFAIVPAGGASVRLAERVGPTRAAQLFYTAGMIDAPIAERWGLVTETVPAEALMDRAHALAAEMTRNSPEVLRQMKALAAAGRSPDRQARLDAEITAFRAHLKGDDLAEGLAAFREKRRPAYAQAHDVSDAESS
ncbi:AMP-binding protein [Cereibacter sphaeroides]|nr:AMP-binding protein [Cereibacter sphaeroides]